MMILRPLLLGAAAAAAACTDAPVRFDGHVDAVIADVRVLDTVSGAVAEAQTLIIVDGVIADIRPAGLRDDRIRLAEGGVRIDGAGALVTPGLWDAHFHIIQEDVNRGVERLGPAALSYGITYVRDMGSSLEARAEFFERLAGGQGPAPRVLSSGPTFWAVALPYGDRRRQRIVETLDAEQAAIEELSTAGVDFVKLYSGFDRAGVERLVARAQAANLPVDGHAQDGVTLDALAALGVRTVEHASFSTFEGCGPVPRAYFGRVIAARFRGSGEAIPGIYAEFEAAIDDAACASILETAAAAGLAFTPTLVVEYLTPAMLDRFDAAAADAEWLEGCALYRRQFDNVPDAEIAAFAAVGRAMVARAHAAGLTLLAGSDAPAFCAPPGQALLWELELLSEAGLSPQEALQSATLNPARVFGLEAEIGQLRPGFAADLVLLEGDPREDFSRFAAPLGVYTQGQWFDRETLNEFRSIGE